jgi:hypothetical protein
VRPLVLILVLVGVLVVVCTVKSRTPSTEQALSWIQVKKEAKAGFPEIELPHVQVKGARSLGGSLVPSPLPATCEEFWRKVATAPKSIFDPNADGCTSLPPNYPPPLRSLHARLRVECRKMPPTLSCREGSFQYWASVVDWQTRDIPLDKIRDPRILAAKLIHSFSETPVKAARVAERILELPSGDNSTRALRGAAAKVQMIETIAQITEREQVQPEGELVDQTAQAIERAGSLLPGDPQVAEADLYLTSKTQDSARLRAKIEAVAESNPTSGLSEYYSGVEEFRQGHPDEALRQVENASRLDPRFSSTVERLQSMAQHKPIGESEDAPGDTPFEFDFGFSLPSDAVPDSNSGEALPLLGVDKSFSKSE